LVGKGMFTATSFRGMEKGHNRMEEWGKGVTSVPKRGGLEARCKKVKREIYTWKGEPKRSTFLEVMGKRRRADSKQKRKRKETDKLTTIENGQEKNGVCAPEKGGNGKLGENCETT